MPASGHGATGYRKSVKVFSEKIYFQAIHEIFLPQKPTVGCLQTPLAMKTLRPTYINKQGNTTNLNNSFSIENEKRAAQVGLEPTTHCLLGRCSTTELRSID